MKMAFHVGVLCWMCCTACVAKPFKVTVRVLDEDGNPIAGKCVTCSTTEALAPGFGWGGGKEVKISGTTDIHGICELRHGSPDGFAAIGISSDAVHYGHSMGLRFTESSLLHWLPWNPTLEITLSKKRDPVPLFVRSIKTVFPVEGESAGFDLLKADWVAPFGQGEESDFVFSKVEDAGGIQYLVGFSRNEDGYFIEKIPEYPAWVWRPGTKVLLEAPLDGYQHIALMATNESIRYSGDSPCFQPNIHGTYFRIRTTIDENGQVKKALYGKLYRGFNVTHMWYGPEMEFLYYLNPTPNDRNLEFDPKRNLAAPPELKSWQRRYFSP